MASGGQGAVHQDGMTEDLERLVQRRAIELDGGQVVWRILGRGRPLVLLHGGHGSWRHWSRNMEALAATSQVCVPDMPGFGESDAPPEPDLPHLLQRLTRSLDALVGVGTRIDLAGFSFGGLVAAHLACDRGDVDRLALLGPAGHGGPRRPRTELVNWRAASQAGDAAALRQAMRHNLLAHMLHAEASVDDEALRIHTEACERTRFRSKAISRVGGLQTLLPNTAHSLLLAWGEHDVTADPAQLAVGLAACHPRARTAIVPGAGHWVHYEAADTINPLLSHWLAVPVFD